MEDSLKVQRQSGNRSLLAVAILALSATAAVHAQEKVGTQLSPKEPLRQFVVLLKRGPNWIPGKSGSEQPLLKHAKYLKDLMDKGSLQFAGPFLDDSGGLILLKAADESEARRIATHDPAVVEGILEPDIHPFEIAFDAATGKSPFK
jgi:uncharacterized protein YciI